MNYKEIVNKICVALGIEVNLEQMKLNDGVTIVEADSFEAGKEIVVVTEDEQRIALPIGEYVLENGMLIVVTQEGIIAEIKEQKEPETPEAEVEVEAEKPQPETESVPKDKIKRTVESMVKETYFAEMEALKAENERLKTELATMQEPKPIVHNPEAQTTQEVKVASTTRDLVLKFINQ